MRKILSCIFLVAVAAWVTACKDDDADNKVANEFSVDNQKYALSTGFYDSLKTQMVGTDTYHFWNVAMASSGITYDNGFVGTGDAIRFDLYTKQDGKLPDGTYTMSSLDNGIENTGIYIGFSPGAGTGTVYSDEVSDASVTIKKSGSTHTITFTAKLSDNKEIKGSFKGTLSEVNNF